MSRRVVVIVACSVGVLLLVFARLTMGETLGWPEGSAVSALARAFGLEHVFGAEPLNVLDVRMLRVVLALIVGAALAGSGVALQGLLRNPLAEPFILGLSTGAALGIIVQHYITYQLGLSLGSGQVGALLGAGGTMAIVFAASRTRGFIDPLGLLLVGVVVSTINGALIMLVNYHVGPGGLRDDLMYWMMGFLNESVSGLTVSLAALASLVFLVVLGVLGPAMDAASFSDAEAESVGVNLRRLREAMFVAASVLAAGAVVLAGPIAFVGIIAPHIARLLVGPTHRVLLVVAALVGMMLILAADSASVAFDTGGQGRVPIGVFTALIGGPVFVWMLRPALGRLQN